MLTVERVDRGTRRSRPWCVFAALCVLASALGAPAFVARADAQIVNGGFETGDFTGWNVANPCNLVPASNWFVYSGTNAPLTGAPISAPPEGNFAATSDQRGPGTHILTQDLVLQPGRAYRLSFSVYYENRVNFFPTPDTLSCTAAPNQQYRVDLITTTAPIDSVAPGDVLANLFRTNVGDPPSLPPTLITADLSAFAGQTVRLRFVQVDNIALFQASVDNVVLEASHALTFFLHGNDIPGTAGGFTMNFTPPPPHTLSVSLLSHPRWFTEPTLTGTFAGNATFKLVVPCTVGVGLVNTFRLEATDPAGGSAVLLGSTQQFLSLCASTRTIHIPVNVPVSLSNQRLKLTISNVLAILLNLHLGQHTFLEATNFLGTP